MYHRFIGLWLACLLWIPLQRTQAAEMVWTADIDAALARAADEKKDLVVLFFNSTQRAGLLWEQEATRSQELQDLARGRVLLKLDFGAPDAKDKQVNQRMTELGRGLKVGTLPSVVLADSLGRLCAKASLGAGDIKDMASLVRELPTLVAAKTRRDQLLAQADKVQGVAKARLLDEALQTTREAQPPAGYEDLVKEIVKLDADNQAGLKMRYQLGPEILAKVDHLFLDRKFQAAVDAADGFVRQYEPQGQLRQTLLIKKGLILADSLGRREEGIAVLEESIAAAPQGTWSGNVASKIKALRGTGTPTRPATRPAPTQPVQP